MFCSFFSFLAILSAARATPSSHIIEAEGQLIALANHDILSKDLFPAISRAVKRNNEVAVPCMIQAVQSLKVDSSRYLSFLVDSIMYFVKQENPEAMMKVQSFIQQAVSRASDVEMIGNLIESILKEMDSMRPTPAVKKQAYTAISSIVKNVNEKLMDKRDLAVFSDKVSSLILGMWKKESNSSVKNSVITVFSAIVSVTDTVSDEVMKVMEDGMKTTGSTLSHYLYLVYSIAKSNASMKEQIVLPVLEEAIKKAVAKPFASGRDGLIALPSLILISIKAGKDETSLLTSALADGSFTYQPSLLNASNKEDEGVVGFCNECVVDLMRIVLTTHCTSEEDVKRVCHYVFTVLDSASSPLKKQGALLLKKLVQSRGTFETLLHAFYSWLISVSSIPFYNDEYPIKRETLLLLLRILQHGAIQEQDVCIFAWCASHPFIANEHHHIGVWKSVVSSMKPVESTEIFTQELKAIVDNDELSVTASNWVTATATQQMLQSLCSDATYCELVYSALIDELTEQAQSAGVNDVTSKDLRIWQTPANVEWKPQQDDVGYVPEVTTSNKKTRGKKGSNPFGKNDDAWIEEYKAEANKDQIAKEAAEKAIAARSKVLEEQAVIRESVNQIAVPYKRALITLRCMIEGGVHHIQAHLTSCMQLIMSLLTNPLVCDLARIVFVHCTCCIQDTTLATILSNTLYHVLYKEFYDLSLPQIVSDGFVSITQILQEGALPSCYLPFFLPIMKAVAFSSECSSVFSSVAFILELFGDAQDEFYENTIRYFRYDVCEILLELLRVAPRIEPSPESILMTYCDAKPSMQQREVFLLLGDRGLLNASEDVRMNSLLNLEAVENVSGNLLYTVCLMIC